MSDYSCLKTANGDKVYSYEYIQSLRDADRKKANPLKIIAQKGAQEKALWQEADILIYGGMRGGAKTFSLLLEAINDVKNKNFYAVLLRNEKDDLLDMINTSHEIFTQFGQYNKSINDMTWYFKNGGKLKYSYYSDAYEEFKKRFQGKQFSYIGIDEITHCSYEKF